MDHQDLKEIKVTVENLVCKALKEKQVLKESMVDLEMME